MEEFYLARDKDGTLCIFNHVPICKCREYINDLSHIDNYFSCIESKLFPKVTFENSPVKIEIKICDTEK